jgi:hypothetical protein
VNPLSPLAPRLTWLAAAFVVAFCALVASVGADAQWLAALGRDIAELGSIPAGIPYAAADSSGWQNVPVAGELAFHGLEAGLGDRGLLFALVAAVAVAVAMVALDMRRADAADAPSALVLLLVAVAASQSLLVIRGQLFSLALFPALVVLLRKQARMPSDAIWLLVPLFALWSNLHGGVLVGFLVAAAYLILDRVRRTRLTAVCVLVASAGALLLTPALLQTHDYYRSVLGSEAVAGREGLWAPLSLHKPLDLAFLAAGIPLVLAAIASKPRFWELATLCGLGAMTFQSGRNGVWLVLFAAAPAARWLTGSRSWRLRLPRAGTALVAAALVTLVAVGLIRTLPPTAAGEPLRAEAAAAARDRPILADDLDAEALALDGYRVWMANPIDAFDRIDQRLYLDWLAGRPAGDALLERFSSALVLKGEPAEQRLASLRGWHVAAADARAALYVRTRH